MKSIAREPKYRQPFQVRFRRNYPHARLLILAIVASMLVSYGLTGCLDEDNPDTTAEPRVSAADPTEASGLHQSQDAHTEIDAPEADNSNIQNFTPEFEKDSCQFMIPENQIVECGYLTVPEDHNQPLNGRTIRLHVARFRSVNPKPASDPIVYLAGGPGANALESLQFQFEESFAPMLADRDLIVFDQRGTGYSQPSLACPELVETTYEMLPLDLSPEEVYAENAEALFECHTRLVSEGIDLSTYNSAQSAADIEALRKALGYDQWNLYGASYGTRLAQTVMRDHPDGIRSVVLDSAYPIDANMNTEIPTNVWRSMELFFATCAADPACAEAYPDLKASFFDLVDQLNQDPVLVSVPHIMNGERYDALVDGTTLLGLLIQSLYQTELSSLFPLMLENLKQTDNNLLAGYLANWLVTLELVSTGMQFSVQCNEEASFADPLEVSEAFGTYPELEAIFASGLGNGRSALDICERWESGEAGAIENKGVESDLPTLILAGEHDPVTPPTWGRQVAAGLSNHFFFEFPGVGHGPSLTDDCPRGIVGAFLNDPFRKPDSSCIRDMSYSFVTPFEPDGVEFEEIRVEAFNINAVAPTGWIRVNDEYFLAPDRTIELVIRENREQPLDSFMNRWGVGDLRDQISTNDVAWSIYESSLVGDEVGGYVAIAPSENGFYVVMLITSAGEQEALYNAVLLPIVSSITID